ncbi:hypothetical protein RsTz2092_12870 [Deferribacterales bacterium RsTz2092]
MKKPYGAIARGRCYFRILAVVFFALLFPVLVLAQDRGIEANKATIARVVTGYGKNKELALKDAFASAVQEVVGTSPHINRHRPRQPRQDILGA